MRRQLISIIVMLLSMTIMSASAQDSAASDSVESKKLSLTSVAVSTGEGAVTSGITVNVDFASKGGWNLSFLFNPDNTDLGIKKSWWDGKIIAGPHIGYMFNLPYGSWMTVTNLIPRITTLHWQGFMVSGNDGPLEGRLSFSENPTFFSMNQLMVDLGSWDISYTLLHFMGANHLGGAKYTHQLAEKFSAYIDVGYSFTNSKQLLVGGVIYTP